MSITFNGVTVEAQRPDGTTRVLLADVTAELAEHRIAVVGPNGSGKSTLLKLINGLMTPTRGSVTVQGIDVASAPRRVRRSVGFIFTDPAAQLVMSTPVDDVGLSLRRTIKNRAERRERAAALLAERGLTHVLDQSIHDLSGGERQLVSLTSVLAVEPEIIVADEPTTLLDLRNRNLLRRTFASLPQQMIISTHDLELAATCERVLVVEDGRIVDDGTAATVLPRYRERMA